MEAFFLGLFLFGALFTVASIALGFVHALPGHDASVAHELGHGAHAETGHGALAHAEAGHGGAELAPTHGGLLQHIAAPIFNASSAIGFVTWFGAGGYILLRISDWALWAVLIGATVGGAAGAYLIARFLKLVLAGERVMDPSDYRLEGTLANVTITIPPHGTGEILFSKQGSRRSEAARSLDGALIPRGTEVVITQYERGIATVQSWAEFLAARDEVGAEHKEG